MGAASDLAQQVPTARGNQGRVRRQGRRVGAHHVDAGAGFLPLANPLFVAIPGVGVRIKVECQDDRRAA